jgi:hypothetical protein
VLYNGKGKANPSPEAEGSRKRKSPMISALSSQLPKSTCMVKSNEFVESEDDDDSVVQVCPPACFLFLSFYVADFAWRGGRSPSPPLYNYCKDTQLLSFTWVSQEKALRPCHSKLSFCVQNSNIYLQCIRSLPAYFRRSLSPLT